MITVTYVEARIGYQIKFGKSMPENMTYKTAAEEIFKSFDLNESDFTAFLSSVAVRTSIDDYIHGRNEFAIKVGM